MKYKVGDKVRIRKDLYFGGNYGIACNNDMPHYAGVETVITHITKFGNYALSADKGANYWSADMLEPAEEQKKVLVFPEWAKWIARDADESLWVYEDEPNRNIIHETWEAEFGDAKRVPADAYAISEIGWEDKPINLYAPAFTAIDPDDSNRSIYTPVTQTVDNVNHPAHYKHGEIETLDIIRMSLTAEEFQGFLKGNVLKYQIRAPHKHETPDEDYAKAKYYYDEYREVTE